MGQLRLKLLEILPCPYAVCNVDKAVEDESSVTIDMLRARNREEYIDSAPVKRYDPRLFLIGPLAVEATFEDPPKRIWPLALDPRILHGDQLVGVARAEHLHRPCVHRFDREPFQGIAHEFRVPFQIG